FQVTPKISHLHAVKRIFRYLKGQPKLGLWYPKDSPFDLEAYIDSDYAGAIANSTTKAEYVAASNCCGQVLWIQNQLLDYGYNFMNTKIFIDNESTICIVKNPVFHSKTKHIEIRHHFIRDSYEKKLIHTDHNVADLLIKIENLTPSFNDEYDTPSHTKKVFANMRRQGKDFSGTMTPLFGTMLIQPQADVGEDETVHEERGDSMERAATTATSLDAEQDSGSGPRCQDTILGDRPTQTRFERLSKQSNDPPLSGVNTPRSGEDRLKIMKLIEIYTNLSDRVLALENVKTAQDLEITSLKKRVKKLEKKKKAITSQLKRRLFKVRIESSADKSLDDQEDTSKQGMNKEDEDISCALITTAGISVSIAEPSIASAPITTTGTLMKMRREKSKEKAKERGSKGKSYEPATRLTRGVTMQEPSESGTRKAVPPSQHDLKYKGKAKMIEPKKPLKKKDQIKFDKEVAKRLTEELEAELEEEERVAIQREEEANLISWDNTQAMMEADYELAQRLQAKEQEELTIEERSRLFVELMDKRKKHFSKLRVKEIKRKPPTKAQKRNQMSTYLRNMVGYKHTQLKNKSFEEIQMLFDKEMKRVNSFVPMDSEVVEGSEKKTKTKSIERKQLLKKSR
ncbi:hypothetical protein Tco_0412428, partial [Tanacetum coccineum]